MAKPMDNKKTVQINTEKNTAAEKRDLTEAAASFGAVILAAGYSSRMKAFKPLLSVGGMPAVYRIAHTLRNVGISDIIIVTGYSREKLSPVVQRLGLAEAYNENYDRGMFSSVRAGLVKAKARFSQKKALLLMPVDCPLVSEQVLKTMIAAASEAAEAAAGKKSGRSGDFCVPVYEGKKGHPLVIPVSYIDEICAYDGPGGLKGVTDKYWERMNRVPVEDEGCLLDMDTPEGYEEIKEFLQIGGKRQGIRKLAEGRRIFLIRHGETQQHDEKMFIGQYDIQLSDSGREQMKKTASELAAESPRISRIYTSDLVRAEESSAIIAELLSENTNKADRLSLGEKISESPETPIAVEKIPAFREINLGDWDGRRISDIKEKHPEEYLRRGTDLFAFKTGNKAENFYDLQYRAIKALRGILQTDRSHDIVIVTHSGVVRALENNLKGLRVDDSWEKLPKGEVRIVKL